MASYRDRNTLLFQFRMSSFYRVLIFYFCLQKLDSNKQGIFVLYREGKKQFKVCFRKEYLGKEGVETPRRNKKIVKSSLL